MKKKNKQQPLLFCSSQQSVDLFFCKYFVDLAHFFMLLVSILKDLIEFVHYKCLLFHLSELIQSSGLFIIIIIIIRNAMELNETKRESRSNVQFRNRFWIHSIWLVLFFIINLSIIFDMYNNSVVWFCLMRWLLEPISIGKSDCI